MAATAQNHMEPLRSLDDKKDEDRDDEPEYSPFYGIEKGLVLQEAREFNNAQVEPRKCQQIITKLLYLLTQGEHLTKTEASDVFFSVTKLFQHPDVHLRRMVYLVIKEVIPSSDEVIIITSSLMKDMNSRNELYRANAIRVLCRIIDPGMLLQIERYLKQAVVDKSPVVASAVLAGAIHLSAANADVIRRWASEIGEAMASRHPMVAYQAVALSHVLRASDRLAVSKLVTQLTRPGGAAGVARSPMAQVLLVRFVAQVVADAPAPPGGAPRPFYDFLEACLRHRSEVVIFEAARAICALRDVTPRELAPAVTVLQLFLSSAKPVLRFAAVRALSRVAAAHPAAVSGAAVDMEALIGDPNRSVATLAITTLLATGSEAGVERLLKQISGFMSEIADEFKIVVVRAVRALCAKHPAKHRALLAFLAGALREDGGYETKAAIVDAVAGLLRDVPEARDAALGQLCEFIEDCEYGSLATRILHLLAVQGPDAAQPARYVRYIFNRVILEAAPVRAAALAALAQFGARCEDLRERVIVLLRRARGDADDEVRDRAALYLEQLTGGAPEAVVEEAAPLPARALRAALDAYLASGDTSAPFDLAAVRDDAPPPPPPRAKAQGLAAATGGGGGAAAAAAGASGAAAVASLARIPALAALGPVHRSSPAVALTEEGTEYAVALVVHALAAHVVLAFELTNTVREQEMEDASVALDLADDPHWEVEASIPLAAVPHDGAACAFVVLARREGAPLVAPAAFAATLRFRVKEIDPATGEAEEEGYPDEYSLEDVELRAGAFVAPLHLADWAARWEAADEASELTDAYDLGVRDSLADAVEAVAAILGMTPADASDAVPPNARSHTLLLAGSLPGGVAAYARVAFGVDAQRSVAMRVSARGDSPDAAAAVHAIIQAS